MYRREGDTEWKTLKSDLMETIFVWDTTSVPNGTYTVKVVASDAPSNTPGTALEGELESSAFDIDNSPHVPFFLPIIEELQNRGIHVVLTARAAYQVCDLIQLFSMPCKVVGRHYGKNKLLKVVGNCLRAAELLPLAIARRPDLAARLTPSCPNEDASASSGARRRPTTASARTPASSS